MALHVRKIPLKGYFLQHQFYPRLGVSVSITGGHACQWHCLHQKMGYKTFQSGSDNTLLKRFIRTQTFGIDLYNGRNLYTTPIALNCPKKRISKSSQDKSSQDASQTNTDTSLVAELLYDDLRKEDNKNRPSTHDEHLEHLDNILRETEEKISLRMEELEEEIGPDGGNMTDFADLFQVYSGANENVPISNTPCSGCGAHLHCQNPGVPGYLPSKKFMSIESRQLNKQLCQRCFLMKKYNFALNVNVDPEEYRNIISQIKDETALVVLMVDLLDMPNSIFPNLNELIGYNHSIYLIGNKVDLIPMDEKGYLKRISDTLLRSCQDSGLETDNVEHISLISARTGYGIEDLVTRLMREWARRGKVYIIGCTNVGKSTLFNALLGSDYCKATARDIVTRATTCRWPGTTLNLLKFPIVDPTPARMKERVARLKEQEKEEAKEEALRRDLLKDTKKHKFAQLRGQVTSTEKKNSGIVLRTDFHTDMEATYTYSAKQDQIMQSHRGRDSIPEPELHEARYKDSRWCYDTPGVVNPAQIVNILTQEELIVLLNNKLMYPRTYVLKPQMSLFVSGLARLDYLEGKTSIYFTVFANSKIPVHAVDTADADEFYEKHVGTKELGIPLGNAERLNKLPPLEGQEFSLTGTGWDNSVADILLSSIGWVAVSAGTGMSISVRASTPGSRGCGIRQPPMLPYAVNRRGKRIKNTRTYVIKPPKM